MSRMRRKLVVMIDGEDAEAQRAWSWGHEAESRVVSTQAEMIAALSMWTERGHEVLAVQGSDAFLGTVLTSMQRHFTGSPLQLFALPATSSNSHVAAWLGGDVSMSRQARYLLKTLNGKGELERTQVATLRLSNSLDEAPRYGFNFAAGLFYELDLIRRRGGLSGASQLAQLGVEWARAARSNAALEPMSQAVMSRDRLEVGPMPRGVLCGALPRAMFEISLSHPGGARMVSVESEAEAVALVARGKAPLVVLRGEAGERFGVLQLDRLAHYVFDGEDHVADARSITQISAGPEVMMWC